MMIISRSSKKSAAKSSKQLKQERRNRNAETGTQKQERVPSKHDASGQKHRPEGRNRSKMRRVRGILEKGLERQETLVGEYRICGE